MQLIRTGMYGVVIGFSTLAMTEENTQAQDFPSSQLIAKCQQAKQGELEPSTVDISSARNNAYLLDCAMAVRISEPGEKKTQTQAIRQSKQALADFLLKQPFDVKSNNQYGDTLLMTTILSYFPDKWKEQTVKFMLDKGVDVKHKNQYGVTASSLAKDKGNQVILTLLNES